MARDFDGASSEEYITTSSPISAFPLSMAAWFYVENITAVEPILSIGDKDVDIMRFIMYSRGDLVGDPLQGFHNLDGTQTANANSTIAITANVWHHGLAVYTAANDVDIYLDGGNSANDTVGDGAISGLDQLAIAGRAQLSTALFFDGRIAEAAVWNASLTAAEAVTLGKGFSPAFVRPQNLVFHASLIREVIDVRGGLTLTAGGTPTVIPHPRMIYPSALHIITAPAAAVTTSPWNVYAQQ